MEPIIRERVVRRIERLDALDPPTGALRDAIRTLVPQGSRLKDLLSGTWLGHPLHPPLTDVVIGSWTSALILDRAGVDDGADLLVMLGALAAAPTALSGLSDWADLPADTRRVGAVHALGNTGALALHALSALERRRGARGRGRALSAIGMALAMGSAWLGGHLSFGRGVGVNQTAFERLPDDWTAVAEDAALPDEAIVGASADGVGIVLARQGGDVWALLDRCSHRGCALREGALGEGTITCPCHGSTFRLSDGGVVRGPATSPQPWLTARVRAGKVEVRAPREER